MKKERYKIGRKVNKTLMEMKRKEYKSQCVRFKKWVLTVN